MIRTCLTLVVAVLLAACQPALKIDEKDPWASLYPWKHDLSGVQKTENGVEYIVIRKGDPKGTPPSPVDRVTVNYEGRLASDGTKFDSSYDRNEPASFRLNEVIPGWTEGLQKMRPGDEVMFWIPSAQGYGDRGAGGAIPPNADLMFRVELLSVAVAPASDVAAWEKARPWPTASSDVVRTSSGLEYLRIGSNATPPASDPDMKGFWQSACFQMEPTGGTCAIVHFRGELDDGSVVASSFDDQQEAIFPIAQLVPGWSETLGLMRPGDRWLVRMPPGLLYGAEGDGRIPPNATVVFEILMMDTVDVPKTAPPPEPATPR
jgi:FKBP-type peptidyl-prolyl cis-trans isomerase